MFLMLNARCACFKITTNFAPKANRLPFWHIPALYKNPCKGTKKNALLQEICVFSIIFYFECSLFSFSFPIPPYHFPRLNRTFLQFDGYIRPILLCVFFFLSFF